MIATIRKTILIGALALCPLLVSPKALAQTADASGTFAQTGTGLQTISITSNGTFSLDLNITTTFNSNGITFFLQSNDGINQFQITGRSNVGGVYNDPTSGDGQVLDPMNAILDPINGKDLGYTDDAGEFDVPGTYYVGTVTLQGLNLMVGSTYHIFMVGNLNGSTRPVIGDDQFNTHYLNVNEVTINVVPEPSTYALLGLAAVGFAVVVYRRKAAVAC